MAEFRSGRVRLLPVSNKLQAKMNHLKEVIKSQKSDVRRIGGGMRVLIEMKETEIIKELDSIWDAANARIDRKKGEVQEKIEEVEKRSKEIKKNYDEMRMLLEQMNQTLPPLLPQISEAVESAKRELDISIPYLNLTWRVYELRKSINIMCRVEQVFKEEATPSRSLLDQAEIGTNEARKKEEKERRLEMELNECRNRHGILEQSVKTADNENEILKREVEQFQFQFLESRTKSLKENRYTSSMAAQRALRYSSSSNRDGMERYNPEILDILLNKGYSLFNLSHLQNPVNHLNKQVLVKIKGNLKLGYLKVVFSKENSYYTHEMMAGILLQEPVGTSNGVYASLRLSR